MQIMQIEVFCMKISKREKKNAISLFKCQGVERANEKFKKFLNGKVSWGT
jgi:hypothetical protein